MSVELDPPELGFRRRYSMKQDLSTALVDIAIGPFKQEVSQSLRLSNPSSDTIAFKVKTTAPKQYCVRPNSGKIDAGQAVEVQVLLQAMKEDPPPDARCRDKFLVQTAALAPDSDASNIPAISIEKANKSAIQERKIRVVFLPADGSSATPSHHTSHGQYLGDEAPPAYGSPAPSFGSPAPNASTPMNRSATDSKDQAGAPATESTMSNMQSTASNAASSVANAFPTSGEDLRAQLDKAKAEISRLTRQTEEQGLRQRKSDAVNQDSRERVTTGTTGMGIQQQPAEGVPVQIVAALCLVSFLLAYFLF
ncbi:MAG: hypothetical protein L6R39_001370 [Caloplaca ligustica]|nr:MAG: hypothetical protein L6R39_001370 [Caloplaca ligustica]